jgi:hypothetical protein
VSFAAARDFEVAENGCGAPSAVGPSDGAVPGAPARLRASGGAAALRGGAGTGVVGGPAASRDGADSADWAGFSGMPGAARLTAGSSRRWSKTSFLASAGAATFGSVGGAAPVADAAAPDEAEDRGATLSCCGAGAGAAGTGGVASDGLGARFASSSATPRCGAGAPSDPPGARSSSNPVDGAGRAARGGDAMVGDSRGSCRATSWTSGARWYT